MKNKILLANKEIEKVVNFLKENIKAFNYMNLKLHDVSYYCYREMEKDFPLLEEEVGEYNYFYLFCEQEYDFFEEDLKENFKIDFCKMRHQLGRTSSFYLHDQKTIDITVNGFNFDNTIHNLIYNFYSSSVYLEDYFKKDGTIDIDKVSTDDFKEYEEVITDELDYIIKELYKDFNTYVEDIITVYNYIKDFKDNQVETFKEFLKYHQEQKEEELRLEKEEEDKAIENVLMITDKYKITKDDLTVLSVNNHVLHKVEEIML